MNKITESNIETFAVETLKSLGWEYIHGLAFAQDTEHTKRKKSDPIILIQRLLKAVGRVNPDISLIPRNKVCNSVLCIYISGIQDKSQIRILTRLRETLQPKLMRGEIRVKVIGESS